MAARVGPVARDGVGEVVCGWELSSTGSVGADEVGVAEVARRRGAVLLAARPQVAPREAAEDGGTSGMSAFALERVEDFFDAVGHREPCETDCIPFARFRGQPTRRWRFRDEFTGSRTNRENAGDRR